MKKIIQITLAATLFLLSASVIFAAEVSVIIDGKQVEFTQESGSPFIDENNRTQTPFRQTLEAFGATVDWEPATRTAVAEKNGITVRVPIGTNYIYKNDLMIVNDTTSMIVNNRTYLPIRIVLEVFGADVSWDGVNRSIKIVSEGTGRNIGFIIIREQGYSTALTELRLSFMNLQDNDIAPLRYMVNLERLDLSFNQISDLSPLSGLTNLEWLFLSTNEISDLSPLSGLANLASLSLGENEISDLSLISNLVNLNVLHLDNNPISGDLAPLSGLTNLWRLTLINNQIDDVSPLSNLVNLNVLQLDNNQISDVSPLSNLVSLTVLGLNENQISDLSPLAGLTMLEMLYLYGNPITDWSPIEHMRQIVKMYAIH